MTLSTTTRPALAAEQQLARMEEEARKQGASDNFELALAYWSPGERDGTKVRHDGRYLYVERDILGELVYRRWLDGGWFVTPAWATAHITRDEALMMLAAFYAESEAAA